MSYRITRSTSPLKTRQTSPVRILLVNDFPILSLGIQQLLQKHAHDIVLVGTIQDPELLHEAGKTEHDVALFDIDGMHGPDSLRLLKAYSPGKVLAWTHQTDRQTLAAILEAGADGVVPKSMEPDTLMSTLRGAARNQPTLRATRMNPTAARQSVTSTEQFAQQKRKGPLTPKQSLIVTTLGKNENLSTEDLANQLDISIPTLRKHIANIYTKLGISNRVALYAYARQQHE